MPNKVIILLATYNRANLLGHTLNSILEQTFTNWECIIIDDNSTDNTAEVVMAYTDSDSRFFYQIKPIEYGSGLSGSRNFGLELARGRAPQFIQFFDDDDLMHPLKLELQVKDLINHPQAKFNICGAKNFRNYHEILWDESVNLFELNGLSLGEAYLSGVVKFVAQVPLFRYECAKKFKFDEDLYYAEEWVLFSKFFLVSKPKYTILNKILFYRRKHPESITEGEDHDFRKRKTIAITDYKIFDYLCVKRAHTRTTLFYFARKFLVYRFDSNILKLIKIEIKNTETSSRMDYFRFVLTEKVHWVSRKILLRLLK